MAHHTPLSFSNEPEVSEDASDSPPCCGDLGSAAFDGEIAGDWETLTDEERLLLDEWRSFDIDEEAEHLDPNEFERLQNLVRFSGVELALKRRRR